MLMRALLILLLLPGLLMPVALQVCVCAAADDGCCGTNECCCSALPLEPEGSTSISSGDRCQGCIELANQDGGQRLSQHGDSPVQDFAATAPVAIAQPIAALQVSASKVERASALAPPRVLATVPLRI
jgi:hypothetical protein